MSQRTISWVESSLKESPQQPLQVPTFENIELQNAHDKRFPLQAVSMTSDDLPRPQKRVRLSDIAQDGVVIDVRAQLITRVHGLVNMEGGRGFAGLSESSVYADDHWLPRKDTDSR